MSCGKPRQVQTDGGSVPIGCIPDRHQSQYDPGHGRHPNRQHHEQLRRTDLHRGATTYDAYIRRSNDADRTDRVDNIDYDYVVYIPDASLTLNVQDQVTLPSPVSASRPVVKVETKKDPLGQVCVVAYVGGA